MELKEAIEILGAFKLANIIEMITQEEFEDVKMAIDTVLNELDNRIPIYILENKKEELEKIKLCGGAVNQAVYEEKIQMIDNILKWR